MTPIEHQRLLEIVERAAPDALPIARDAANARWLTDEECKALTDALMDVFTDHLGTDDEPDREGVEADDLVGRIEMQRAGYWRR